MLEELTKKSAKTFAFHNQRSISRVNLQGSWMPSLHSTAICVSYWTYLSREKNYKLLGKLLDMPKITVSLTKTLVLIILMCGDIEKNPVPYHL